jgi:bilin biosynthesis protein
MIQRSVHVDDLIESLKRAETALSRQILSDILGYRGSKRAVAVLIEHLEDDSLEVRASAADALAKISDRRAGEALLRRLDAESSDRVKQMLAAALGAVGYEPAIPRLIELLDHPDATIRGCAAWSLGVLQATSALEVLQNQLELETNEYSLEQISTAILEIKSGATADAPPESAE